MLHDSYYYDSKGLVCYVYLFHNPYRYGELSIHVLFISLQDTPAEVHFLFLYFDIQEMLLFNMVYL